MRRYLVLGLVALLWGYDPCAVAQVMSCPGGDCSVPQTFSSSNVRASVRSRSGPGGGGVLGGLGRLLSGRRGGGGASVYGSAYAAPAASGGLYAAPQVLGSAYAAPGVYAEGGSSCYSSMAGAGLPMSLSPYAAPPTYSAPPMYAAPPPVIYSTPQTFLEDERMSLAPWSSRIVSITVLPERVVSRPRVMATRARVRRAPVERRLATRAPQRERRPTAVAVRPEETPSLSQLAEIGP